MSWSDSKADSLLASHNYGGLDLLLREFVDVRRHHAAVDWLHSRSERGHVIVLYHALRNAAKYSGSSGRLVEETDEAAGGGGGGGGIRESGGGSATPVLRVMGSSDFRNTYRLYVLLLLRIIQDSLSVCAVQGHALHTHLYTMLRDKIFGWLTSQFPMTRWPHLDGLLDELQSSPCASSIPSLPSPVWIISSSPSTASFFGIGSHVYFNNPSSKFVEACERTIGPLNEERVKLTAGFFTLMREISWSALTSIGMSAFVPPIKLNAAGIVSRRKSDSAVGPVDSSNGEVQVAPVDSSAGEVQVGPVDSSDGEVQVAPVNCSSDGEVQVAPVESSDGEVQVAPVDSSDGKVQVDSAVVPGAAAAAVAGDDPRRHGISKRALKRMMLVGNGLREAGMGDTV